MQMPDHEYFGVKLDIDQQSVDKRIEELIDNKLSGYVCSVERNVMSTSFESDRYRQIINSSSVNICDGRVLALVIRMVYGVEFSAYVGADLFIKYVKYGRYKQYFLGNTQEVLNGLKEKVSLYDKKVENMQFMTLPFLDVDEFDYEDIARQINNNKPDIIWVSLGAPKQEQFMYNLYPHLNQGVMFGFGAIFNFYSGVDGIRRAPVFMQKLGLEWLHRMLQDPKKNFIRNVKFLSLLPSMIKKYKYGLNEDKMIKD